MGSIKRNLKKSTMLYNSERIHLIGGLKRIQTRVTPGLIELVKKFPGKDEKTLKGIANFVFEQTPVREVVRAKGDKFSRTSEQILKAKEVDLLHCYDRSHALLGILNAKRVPAWLVVSIDFRGFAHTYVETLLGKDIHTVAFRTYHAPLIEKGKVEETISHASTELFIRGGDLGNLGVNSQDTLKRFVENVFNGKKLGTIKVN